MQKFKKFLHFTWLLASRRVTARQFSYIVKNSFLQGAKFRLDDFDWESYTKHYSEELRVLKRNHTLILKPEDYKFHNAKLIQINPNIGKLHANHELLYRTILTLNPITVLEIGCGSGDHLSNLVTLNNDIQPHGVDVSMNQLTLLKTRHPNLSENVHKNDITSMGFYVDKCDLVFTQAVLMHIADAENRLELAIDNILKSALHNVVLMENWMTHDFLKVIRASLFKSKDWRAGYLYSNTRQINEKVPAVLVISKSQIMDIRFLENFRILSDHDSTLF